MSRKAKVTFYYKAEQDDEINLEVGDVITNIIDKDTGWCEGEVNGRRGMFPNNFVEFIPNGEEKASVQSESHSVAGKKGKVTFRYEAENDDELTLEVDDIVDILGEEEEGWWKGRLQNRIGVFPSNFVDIIEDTGHSEPNLEEKPGVPKTSKREPIVSNEEAQTADGEEKQHSAILQSRKLPGVGFGDLVNPGMLAKKLKKVHHDDKKEERNEPTVTEAEKVTPTKGPKSAKTRPAPPVPAAPQSKKLSEFAKVICDYDPQDRDELRIRVGDIITVTNKDVADNEGWWEGELNGKVGMFPNNFVELLPSDDAVAPTKDKPTDLPPTSKKGIPVLPVASEGPKPPVSQEKRAPPLPAEEKRETRPVSDMYTPEKPAVSKPPVKREKPNLPPKKPLHLPKKPEKKLVEEKGSSAAKTKVSNDSNETDEAKLRESSHARKKSKEENTSSNAPVTLQPEIKTEDFADGGISFDSIPETQTLNHLTANRAKNPQKRPPSKDGRLTDSAHLSVNLDDQPLSAEQVSHEAQKQAPGRPKEPPKEPAWKREAREIRENKVPPATLPKEDAIEKRKSLREELLVSAPLGLKGQTVSSVPSADVEKLYKQISELRDLITDTEKKHNDAVKKLEEKFNREIESLTNDFDEERKQNAALKVEIDRLKRRVAKLEE